MMAALPRPAMPDRTPPDDSHDMRQRHLDSLGFAPTIAAGAGSKPARGWQPPTPEA